jgi:hypothetical protein
VLYPAIAEAAHRMDAKAVGLIDVGCSAGLNLHVDRVGITYSNGQSLGDPSSPVQLSSSIVGGRPIPTRVTPAVVARVGVDLDPIDVTDAVDARWLRACLAPDQSERLARLDAEMALATAAPPLRLQGNAVEVLPDAIARVPADALPVVTTTWALSHFPLESRLRFLHRLDEAAAGRAVAWVSAEAVGVCATTWPAPAPTSPADRAGGLDRCCSRTDRRALPTNSRRRPSAPMAEAARSASPRDGGDECFLDPTARASAGRGSGAAGPRGRAEHRRSPSA